MSGLEIFGAVAAAATLFELAKACANRLKKHEKTHRDIAALRNRVEILADIVTQVSEVLESIRLQRIGQADTTKSEIVIWQRMDAVLELCRARLVALDARLDQILYKGVRKLSTVPPDIVSYTKDLMTYIQALDMLKGLFQLIFQRQQSDMQYTMHQNIIGLREFQEDRMDTLLRRINQINDQLQQPEQSALSYTRSESFQSNETLHDNDANRLSTHLNKIVIAATDVRASFSGSKRDSMSQVSLQPSLTYSDAEHLPGDPPPDITHVEPLSELAQRFRKQAEYDIEHHKYKDAEVHQLESIECFKELHDAHKIPFDTYNEMMMRLARIYKNLKRYEDAKRILESATKHPLLYDQELGWKISLVDTSENTEHRAYLSHEMAELYFDCFTSSSGSSHSSLDGMRNDWELLYDAECNAKRAFRIRRDLYGKDHEDCKETARLLYNIYANFPNKRMYAETYSDIYLTNDDHRNVLVTLRSGSTSGSRSMRTSEYSNLADAVKDHHVPAEDVGVIMSNSTLTELEQLLEGKSLLMVAMDCIDSKNCNRCFVIVDKLLRLGADRDAPFAYAAKRSRTNICESLLKHGADIDWLDSDRITPLMYAIKQNNIEMVSFLLGHDADVNVRGDLGQTALHFASQTRNEDIFKLLLKSTALDLDARDDSGLTALHHCAKQDNINFAKRLRRAGASLEMKDKSGRERTPLWIAVREDKYTFVKALLKLGAHVDMESLPKARSKDMRNLLNSHQSQGSASGT